jgi:hypothetical protein
MALAVASALVSAGVACSSSTSSTPPADAAPEADEDVSSPDGGSDAGACALPATYGSKACQACVGERCCGPIGKCEGDEKCKPLGKCVTDCLQVPDAGGCRKDCFVTYPDTSGRALWDAVEHCWFSDPPTGCLLDCT